MNTTPYVGRDYTVVADNVELGAGARIGRFVNLYGCSIGDNTVVGAFVEVQRGARVGRNCKIESHSFVCEGVTIEDNVFVGHGVIFINDKYPRATRGDGTLQGRSDWTCIPTLVRAGASIGSGATILCGVTVGARAVVGAGSTVTRDVPEGAIVAGCPARFIRKIDDE
jgi:UDP-2-acetamido-3-amino-2,3-dideoxy-glucuronate N-acetyltransferase